MNRQRKVLITTTYNELGIIIDTKAEEVAQPELQPTCDQLATDCISRQQAIEAFEPTHYKDWYTPTIIETLETLPSVRPEVLACGNGELVKESDGLVKDLVKDCISRQQAIDALDKHIDTFDAIDKNYLCGLRTAMSILKEMPSAQPERKTGRWKLLYDNIWICTNCEQTEQFGVNIESTSDYCPNCGARMMKEGEEHD